MTTLEQSSTSLASPFADPIIHASNSVDEEPSVSGPAVYPGQSSSPLTLRLTGVMIQTQDLMKKALEEVAKPSVASFMEICDNNPKLAAVIAAPALLGLALVLLFFAVSVIVLSVWTFSTILVGVIVVVVGGLLSLLLKLILVTAATLPLAAMATGFFVATITLFKFVTSPAATLVWAISSSTKQSTATATESQTSQPELQPETPQESSTSATPSPSGHDSGYSNLITATRVAWDTTVILCSFLKWTSQQLWFVGGRAFEEIQKNINEAQARNTSAAVLPEEEQNQVQTNTTIITSQSINTDNVNLVQRPSHTRARDDVDNE